MLCSWALILFSPYPNPVKIMSSYRGSNILGNFCFFLVRTSEIALKKAAYKCKNEIGFVSSQFFFSVVSLLLDMFGSTTFYWYKFSFFFFILAKKKLFTNFLAYVHILTWKNWFISADLGIQHRKLFVKVNSQSNG